MTTHYDGTAGKVSRSPESLWLIIWEALVFAGYQISFKSIKDSSRWFTKNQKCQTEELQIKVEELLRQEGVQLTSLRRAEI